MRLKDFLEKAADESSSGTWIRTFTIRNGKREAPQFYKKGYRFKGSFDPKLNVVLEGKRKHLIEHVRQIA